MPKLKVQVNGSEVEVEAPEGWLSPEEAANRVTKDFMQSEITRRLAQARRGYVKEDEVLESDEFREKALAHWNVQPGKKGLSDEDVAKIRSNIESTLVNPLKQQNEKLSKSLERLYRQDLELQIVNAAREAGVQEHWLKPPREGLPAPIVNMVASYFGQSQEHDGAWFLREGDGFAYAKNPSQAQPFKSVSEFLPEFVSSKENATIFLGDQRQRVGGNNAPANQGARQGSTVVGSDPLTFGRNLEAIASGKAVVAP